MRNLFYVWSVSFFILWAAMLNTGCSGGKEEKGVPLDSIFLSDPCILADARTQTYYMTGTSGKLWKSKDLESWEGPFDVVQWDTASWMGSRPEIWAAELHEYQGKYYYFATFTNNSIRIDSVNGSVVPRRATHVLVSDSPAGPYRPMGEKEYLPADKATLDGTFWVDADGKPYMVYCHEWLQNGDGTIEKIELKSDLSGTIGEGKILFKASDSPWNREKMGKEVKPNRVTDGPWLFRTGTGRLGMIWTSWVYGDYTQGVAYSESGTLEGPWVQEENPVTPHNFGHGMLFRTFNGQWLMSAHSHKEVNGRYIRIPRLFEVDLSGDKLQVGRLLNASGQWLDEEGKYINAHGGGILYHEGLYYWFGEHRPDEGFSTQVGVNCYASADLKLWQYKGVALAVSEEAGSDIERGCIMERPKVIYNKKTGKFVMWLHLELKGQGYGPARAAVAVSDTPIGPYRFVRSGRVNPGCWPVNLTEEERKMSWKEEKYQKWWTPEWRKAVEQGMLTQRDWEGGQMSRDMTLFVDDDGKAYHIYSSEENLTLQIAELSEDYLTHTGKYIRLFPGGHNEAPAIFKKGDTYWMIASGCTGWAPNAARLFSSSSIWGPWTQHPNPCRGEGAEKTFGGQSTFVLELPNEEFLFMADIWKPESLMYSGYLWLPIGFDEAGMPFLEKK